MKEKNVNKAVEFTKQFLLDMIAEKFPLDKLIISKSLRQFYKNPNQIAHKVLAERIGKREPGNKPAVGSRVPFVYIQTKGKPKLQGDRIEDPNYIRRKKLKPDFSFYITNQIQKTSYASVLFGVGANNSISPTIKGFFNDKSEP
jgi:DNA polymerase elongation subunit (family B)